MLNRTGVRQCGTSGFDLSRSRFHGSTLEIGRAGVTVVLAAWRVVIAFSVEGVKYVYRVIC